MRKVGEKERNRERKRYRKEGGGEAWREDWGKKRKKEIWCTKPWASFLSSQGTFYSTIMGISLRKIKIVP